jgi:hypothetical protein
MENGRTLTGTSREGAIALGVTPLCLRNGKVKFSRTENSKLMTFLRSWVLGHIPSGNLRVLRAGVYPYPLEVLSFLSVLKTENLRLITLLRARALGFLTRAAPKTKAGASLPRLSKSVLDLP